MGFLRYSAAACAAAYNKNSGPAGQPRMFRGFSCRGPEQHFLGYYIFLIARYRRTSGSALTATSPSAAAAAARAIVVTYPSVRIIFLLLFRGSAAAARDIDVPHSGAAGLLTWLSSP